MINIQNEASLIIVPGVSGNRATAAFEDVQLATLSHDLSVQCQIIQNGFKNKKNDALNVLETINDDEVEKTLQLDRQDR